MSDVRNAVLGDVRLAYEVLGAASAPPLLLLHGLGEDRSDWAAVGAELAKQFRVVAVDLRGHGESDWPGTYSFQLMADDVVRFLDHLDLDQVTLLGHSMGGSVAYLIAEQQPHRVERLIVEDVSPPFLRERPLPERPQGELGFDWTVVPAIVEEVNRGNATMWEELSFITAPSLLVAGGPDSHIPQEKLQAVANLIPDCTLITIPAGHHVHAARPAEFARTVLDWVNGTTSP